MTVSGLCNEFLTAKEDLVEQGDITRRTFNDYFVTCTDMVRVLGRETPVSMLGGAEFARYRKHLSKGRGPHTVLGHVNRARTVFSWGQKTRRIQPVDYGESFARPEKRQLRLAHKQTKRFFTPDEILALLEIASVPMAAMIWTAINTGIGNRDLALMRRRHIDFAADYMDYPRNKTGEDRESPLWAETMVAIDLAWESRPNPTRRDYDDVIYITQTGRLWTNDDSADSPISKEFSKLTHRLDIHRKGRGFYSLRHTFQTIAERSRDLPAVKRVMGHVDDTDRERFSREVVRLKTYPVRALVCVTSWDELERGEWRSRVTSNSVIGSLLGWQAGGLPVMLVDDRAMAGRVISRILFTAARRQYRTRNDGSGAIAAEVREALLKAGYDKLDTRRLAGVISTSPKVVAHGRWVQEALNNSNKCGTSLRDLNHVGDEVRRLPGQTPQLWSRVLASSADWPAGCLGRHDGRHGHLRSNALANQATQTSTDCRQAC